MSVPELIYVVTNLVRSDLYVQTCKALVRQGVAPLPWVDSKGEGTRECMRLVCQDFMQTGVERLVYCEDDLLLAPDAVEVIRATVVPPGHALVKFFDCHTFPDPLPPGLHSAPFVDARGHTMWGTQCMLFPREVVAYLAALPRETWHAWQNPDERYRRPRHQVDVVLSHLLAASPWPRWAMLSPNVVDHAGEGRSTIWNPDVYQDRSRSPHFKR